MCNLSVTEKNYLYKAGQIGEWLWRKTRTVRFSEQELISSWTTSVHEVVQTAFRSDAAMHLALLPQQSVVDFTALLDPALLTITHTRDTAIWCSIYNQVEQDSKRQISL